MKVMQAAQNQNPIGRWAFLLAPYNLQPHNEPTRRRKKDI